MIEQPQSRHSAFQVLTGLLSLPAGARVGIGPMLAALTLVTIVLASILAPLYVPYDPLAMNSAARLKPPSEEFLLGTDPYGRDTFSRVMVGGRVSLLIGVGAALVSVVEPALPWALAALWLGSFGWPTASSCGSWTA